MDRNRMPAPVKSFFRLFLLLIQFFEHTSPFTPKSGLICSVKLRFDDHDSFVIFRSPTQTSLRSKLRPRLLLQTPFAGSGMPNQLGDVRLHTMPLAELSRVRTELERNTHSRSATSSTNESPACDPSLLWVNVSFRIADHSRALWKGGGLQRVQVPPGNWFAPPGSNRSSGGGNEAAEAFDVKGRYGDSANVQAVT